MNCHTISDDGSVVANGYVFVIFFSKMGLTQKLTSLISPETWREPSILINN